MRISNKLVGLGMLAVLAGCASLNPFASKPKGNQPAELVELKSGLAVRTAWTYAIGKADPYLLSPALVDGQLYVAGADGALARLVQHGPGFQAGGVGAAGVAETLAHELHRGSDGSRKDGRSGVAIKVDFGSHRVLAERVCRYGQLTHSQVKICTKMSAYSAFYSHFMLFLFKKKNEPT